MVRGGRANHEFRRDSIQELKTPDASGGSNATRSSPETVRLLFSSRGFSSNTRAGSFPAVVASLKTEESNRLRICSAGVTVSYRFGMLLFHEKQ